jgi:GH18 family chitinase
MTYDFNGWPWVKTTQNHAPLNDGSTNDLVYSVNGWKKVAGTANNGPYAYSAAAAGATWTAFDDPASALTKVNYIKSKRLGGAMVWDVTMDDYTNACGGGANPILTAISQNLGIS